MEFVIVKAKIWRNNRGSSFFWNTVYTVFQKTRCRTFCNNFING